MKAYLDPDATVDFSFGAVELTMKPVSKQEMLAFFLDYPKYATAILTGKNAIKSLLQDKKEGYEEFMKLIAKSIKEWSLEDEPSLETLDKLNPIILFLVLSAFNQTNFLGTDEANFTKPNQES